MKRSLPILLIVCILCSLLAAPAAAAESEAGKAGLRGAQYLFESVPVLDETGGWAVIAAARGGFAVPEGYYVPYLSALREQLRAFRPLLFDLNADAARHEVDPAARRQAHLMRRPDARRPERLRHLGVQLLLRGARAAADRAQRLRHAQRLLIRHGRCLPSESSVSYHALPAASRRRTK